MPVQLKRCTEQFPGHGTGKNVLVLCAEMRGESESSGLIMVLTLEAGKNEKKLMKRCSKDFLQVFVHELDEQVLCLRCP